MKTSTTRPPPPPCSLCTDPGGPPSHAGGVPVRCDGGRFGVAGLLCLRCWRRIYSRRWRAARGAAPGAVGRPRKARPTLELAAPGDLPTPGEIALMCAVLRAGKGVGP